MKHCISKIILISLVVFSVQATAKGHYPPKKPCGPPPFSKLDIDSNGAVSLAEFSQHKIPRGDHKIIFNRIDVNNDGEIIKQEWLDHKPRNQNRKQKR